MLMDEIVDVKKEELDREAESLEQEYEDEGLSFDAGKELEEFAR